MNYYNINNLDFNVRNIPELPGIYKIIALDDYDEPMILNRFLDYDTSGILYIGKAENLYKRLTNMKRAFSINHLSKSHIAVRRYNSLNTLGRMAVKYPIEKLVIEIELTKNGMKAMELEREAFKKYENQFGERPPLNRQ